MEGNNNHHYNQLCNLQKEEKYVLSKIQMEKEPLKM